MPHSFTMCGRFGASDCYGKFERSGAGNHAVAGRVTALRGRPVIVGTPPTQRGVVCAASYEARKFGVRSALPSATAGRLCPKGIFVRPRMARYQEESREIMRIVAATGAVIE